MSLMPSIKVRVAAARGGRIPNVIKTKKAHHTNSKITMVAPGKKIVVATEDEVAVVTKKARQDSTSTT